MQFLAQQKVPKPSSKATGDARDDEFQGISTDRKLKACQTDGGRGLTRLTSKELGASANHKL